MVIQAVYRGYQIAKKLYAYGKPTVTGKSFISKFPPQHRQTVRTILKGSEIAFTGGLVSDILKDQLDQDGTDHGSFPQRKKSNKFNQTRSRFKRSRRTSSKHKCDCRHCSKLRSNYFQTRRY